MTSFEPIARCSRCIPPAVDWTFIIRILSVGNCCAASNRTGDVTTLTSICGASTITAHVIDTVVRAALIGRAAALPIAQLAGALAITFEFTSAFRIWIFIVGNITASPITT